MQEAKREGMGIYAITWYARCNLARFGCLGEARGRYLISDPRVVSVRGGHTFAEADRSSVGLGELSGSFVHMVEHADVEADAFIGVQY